MFTFVVFFAVINRLELEWSSVFEPKDGTDQEAVGFVENFYAGGFEGLKRLHEKWKCGLLTRENPAVNEYAGGDPWDRYPHRMVFMCPFCAMQMREEVHKAGLEPIFLTNLARMALGEALPTQACGLGDDREDINMAVRIVKGLL